MASAIARMEAGNFSNVESVGRGISECRIHTGPGYRIYFSRDGEALIILLAGGTKRGQQDDIARAQERWQDYKQRKAKEA